MVICKYCGITETSYYKLNKHIAKDHAETESKTQCDKCMKELSSKQTLQKHIKSCNGLSSLQCQYCHKSLSNANSKYRHRKTCKLKQEESEKTQELDTKIINKTIEKVTINVRNNLIIIIDMDRSITTENLPRIVSYITDYIDVVCNNEYRLYIFKYYCIDKWKEKTELLYDDLFEKKDDEKKLYFWEKVKRKEIPK
jgi:hypothetical protein